MRGIVLIWSLINDATDFCVISSEFLFSNKGALILPSWLFLEYGMGGGRSGEWKKGGYAKIWPHLIGRVKRAPASWDD